MKRILSTLIAFLMTLSTLLGSSSTSFADNDIPSISAQYAVLMDYETGEILYNKNGSQKLYPASTTKAWTAYLVLKNVPDLNKKVEIKNIPPVEGSSMYLRDGESFTVKELLEGFLVHSCNDIAVVLAQYVSGSVEKFVDLMNKEAQAIGAKNTHFNNPHGLPDENHYSTAYDMALMARVAMNNNIFREIVKMKSVSFKATQAYPYERYFVNTNKFLNSNEKINYKGKQIDIKYDIVDGIKTGYTDDAGRCLLSSGVKDNMRLIATVFKTKGNDLYLDSRTLLDYGFDNYYSTTIINKDNYIGTKKVMFTKQNEFVYEPKYNYKVVLPKGTKENDYTTKVNLDKVKLPIKKDDKVGTLEVFKGKELKNTIELVATSNLNSIFSFITENQVVINGIKIAAIALVSLITIAIVLVIIRKKRRRKSNKNIYLKKRNIYKKKRKRK